MHRKTINFAIRFNEKRKTKENKHVMQKHIRTNGSSHVSSLVVELERDLQTTSGFLNFYVIRIAVSVYICCCFFFSFLEADSKVDSLSMYLTLIYRKRELTLAMQRVETIKKCDLREIVTLFRHVVNLQVSLCKYGFFVMFLICCHYFQWILEGSVRGVSGGSVGGQLTGGQCFVEAPMEVRGF